MSPFSNKAYNKLITMTGKKVGCSLVSYSHFIFQLTELNIKANPPYFYVHMHEPVLNDAKNYAPRKDAQCKCEELP